MLSYKKAFRLEFKRDLLAKKKEYKKLKLTYNSKYLIKDYNSPTLWDSLNKDFPELENPMATNRINWVAERLREGKRILNVGFGSANLEKICLYKKEVKSEWFGIDISGASVEVASKLFPSSTFIKGNAENIPFKKIRFDYIIALEVLEHIVPTKTLKVLSEFYDRLNNKGILIISVPLNEGLEEMIQQGKNPNAHVRVYTTELIKAELEIAGFNILESHLLYAFHKYYKLKSLITNLVPFLKKPNNIIIVAQKPL